MEQIEELFSKPWSVRVNVRFYLRCGCFLELASREGRSYRLLDVPGDQVPEGSSGTEILGLDNVVEGDGGGGWVKSVVGGDDGGGIEVDNSLIRDDQHSTLL